MSLQFLNTSTINRLPLNPSLEQLRNQAKDLLKAYVEPVPVVETIDF